MIIIVLLSYHPPLATSVRASPSLCKPIYIHGTRLCVEVCVSNHIKLIIDFVTQCTYSIYYNCRYLSAVISLLMCPHNDNHCSKARYSDVIKRLSIYYCKPTPDISRSICMRFAGHQRCISAESVECCEEEPVTRRRSTWNRRVGVVVGAVFGQRITYQFIFGISTVPINTISQIIICVM